jgi:hypothetical protein
MRKRERRIQPGWLRVLLSVVGLISLAAVVLNLIASWRNDDNGAPITTVVGGAPDLGVRVYGQIERDRLEPKTPVDCWFTVVNAGETPIANVTLNWTSPGFLKTEFVPKNIGTIGKGDDFTFQAKPLTPEAAGTYQARVEISWTRNDVRQSRAITLGPIRVRQAQEPRIFALTKAYVDVFKDVAMPLVLLLIPWLLTSQQRHTEADRASWNLMIGKSHENAEKYYLPVVTAVKEAYRALPKLNPSNPATFDALTFHLLLFRKRARVLFEKVAGYYLPTRDAEKLVVYCESAFLKLSNPYINRETRAAAKDAVKQFGEFHTFQRNPKPPDVVAFQNGLIAWAKTNWREFEAVLATLLIMGEVLEYDINLAYRFWYEDPPDPLSELKTEMALLTSLKTEEFVKVAADYQAYREKMTKREW